MQGVLVDDRHAFAAFRDEIAIVDLQGRRRRAEKSSLPLDPTGKAACGADWGAGQPGRSDCNSKGRPPDRLGEKLSAAASRLEASAGALGRHVAIFPFAQSTSCCRARAACAASCPPLGSS